MWGNQALVDLSGYVHGMAHSRAVVEIRFQSMSSNGGKDNKPPRLWVIKASQIYNQSHEKLSEQKKFLQCTYIFFFDTDLDQFQDSFGTDVIAYAL